MVQSVICIPTSSSSNDRITNLRYINCWLGNIYRKKEYRKSELKKLETQKADLKQYLASKETTEIKPDETTTFIAEYYRQLEKSLLNRLRKINDLEEIRETLRELLQGTEIDSLLSPGTIMGTDVATIKETLEKRFSVQPTDGPISY